MNCNQNVKSTASNNVLIKEWEGPYGGVPAFDKMKVEDIKDAMIQGMKLRLIEIENIVKIKMNQVSKTPFYKWNDLEKN